MAQPLRNFRFMRRTDFTGGVPDSSDLTAFRLAAVLFVRACVSVHIHTYTHTHRAEQSHSSSARWRMENQVRRWNDLNICSLILLSAVSFDLLAINWQLNLKRERYFSDQYRLSLPAANTVRVGGPHRAYDVYGKRKRDSDVCHIK
jgi:hypothetical protein